MKILLTGATGFIGSNIAKALLNQNYEVYATHRNSSSFEKCITFKDKINWINTDNSDWKAYIKSINLDQFIHAAWGGIEASDRNNWDIQISNFWFSKELFDLMKECGVKKVIGLGSQAEYGINYYPINEKSVSLPNDAYGSVKTLTANYMRNLFESSEHDWYWIRIFSVFGEGENDNWLIPTVISKLLKNELIPLTSCEQQYNFLYVKDFSNLLLSIINCDENKSGIYNICSNESISLKSLILQIANLMNVSQSLLLFGDIPYREGQNMNIMGDNSKFTNNFLVNEIDNIGLNKGLKKTIEYHKKKEL